MQQRHNARYRSGETIIRYRFHPRYGETVIVTGCRRHGEDVALIIRQPDGTMAHLQVWMTQDRTEAMMVTEFPRLPLAHLFELRVVLDTCLSLLRDDSRRAARDNMKQRQLNLFPPETPSAPISALERSKLLPLVSALVEGDQIHLRLHWQSGDHTRLNGEKEPAGPDTMVLRTGNGRVDPRLRAVDA